MASSVIGSLRVNLGLNSAAFTEGLSNAARSLTNVGKKMQDIGGKFSTYLTVPLAAAGAAVSAAVIGMSNDVRNLQQAANLSGVDFKQFQRLAYGAKSVGFEADKLADIYKDVNDRVGDFMSTGAGPMADFFENIAPKVGITADAFRDLSGPDALQLYYDSLVKAGASQQEITFYLEAMASDVTALIPLLANGGAEMQRLGDRAEETGAIISDDAAAAADRFNTAMRELSSAVTGLATTLVNSGLLDWITEAVNKLAELMRWAQQTNPELVKWGAVVGGLAALIGPTLVALGLMATAIGAISAPVALVVAGIAALTAGIVVFWPEITKLGEVLTAFVQGAWAQFLAAWDGMVVKVEEVKTAFGNFITWIGEAFAALPARMLEIGGQIMQGLADGIMAKWEEVKQGIADIPNNIANTFTGFFNIQSPSKLMHSIGGFIMQGLGDGMKDMEGGVVGVAENMAQSVGNAFLSIIDGSKSVGEALSGMFKNIGSQFLQSGISTLGGLGGGFGFLGNILGGLFGFKDGGSFRVGGSGGIDSQLVAFKASPNERVSVTKPGQSFGDSGSASIHITTDDARFRASMRDEAGNVVAQSAPGIVGAAVAQSGKQAPSAIAKYQNQVAGGDYRLA